MTEQWQPIPGAEGKYDVSDQGRFRSWVYSGKTGIPRPMTPTLDDDGYYRVTLHLSGKRYYRRVHVWVALAFIGPRPAATEVRHLDGDSTNNHVNNLRYGSPSENQYDKVLHGTHHNAVKTHCANGHEYTSENTISRVLPSGHNQRMCRACVAARNQRTETCPECSKSVRTTGINQHRRRQHGAVTVDRRISA